MRSDATIATGVQITISKENYLKTIAEAESEGETVIAATLARWLNVSPPAVTKALSRLKKDKLAEVAKDGRVRLTGEGREIANRLRRDNYTDFSFGSAYLANQSDRRDWLTGEGRARRSGSNYTFDYACRMDLNRAQVLEVDYRLR